VYETKGSVFLVREWIKIGPQPSGKKYGENFKTVLSWDERRRFHSAQLTVPLNTEDESSVFFEEFLQFPADYKTYNPKR